MICTKLGYMTLNYVELHQMTLSRVEIKFRCVVEFRWIKLDQERWRPVEFGQLTMSGVRLYELNCIRLDDELLRVTLGDVIFVELALMTLCRLSRVGCVEKDQFR